MKRLFFLLSCSSALLCAADLSEVRSVYVMPMARGLDQYLASRLASEHVFQVTSDPKLADAFFTDRIGETLNSSLEEMIPAQKPAAADEKSGGTEQPHANSLANPALSSSFGRGKGTLFLVEAKSREVVWSTFEPPKSSNPSHLDRTASDIVSRLKRDLKKK